MILGASVPNTAIRWPTRFVPTPGEPGGYVSRDARASVSMKERNGRSEIRTRVLDDVKCEGVVCWAILVYQRRGKVRSIKQPRVILVTPTARLLVCIFYMFWVCTLFWFLLGHVYLVLDNTLVLRTYIRTPSIWLRIVLSDPSTSSTTMNQYSCRFFNPREIQVLNYVVTKLRHGDTTYQVRCHVCRKTQTAVDNAIPRHCTGYERHDIHILWNRERKGKKQKRRRQIEKEKENQKTKIRGIDSHLRVSGISRCSIIKWIRDVLIK